MMVSSEQHLALMVVFNRKETRAAPGADCGISLAAMSCQGFDDNAEVVTEF